MVQVEVRAVTDDRGLAAWLAVAAACGWTETAADQQRRAEVYRGLGFGHPALTHWVAWQGGRPVGFASSYLDGRVVDLCNLGVLESHRRRGIGRSLVLTRLAEAVDRGATCAVSAPSHDGWQLQRALGFTAVPVIADTCFYLPVR